MILIIFGILIPYILYAILQFYAKQNVHLISEKINFKVWRVECLFAMIGFPLLFISGGFFGFYINAIPPVEGILFSFFYPLIIIFLRDNVFDVISITWNERIFPLVFIILSFACCMVWFLIGFSEIFTNNYAILYILIGFVMGLIPLIPDFYDKLFHCFGSEYSQDDFSLGVAILLLIIITFFAEVINYLLLCPIFHIIS
ncbi:hypothetical protein [Methanobrevibacter sp.]|uniref:hypothetical protein n=1 Tax=Methanobrevibacter sp. TaxID=66852 RepID=UPI00388FC523